MQFSVGKSCSRESSLPWTMWDRYKGHAHALLKTNLNPTLITQGVGTVSVHIYMKFSSNEDIVFLLVPSQWGKTVDSVAARLLWTQYIYTICIERNKRIFYQKKRLEGDLKRAIVDIMKSKLASLPRLEHRLRGSKVAISPGLTCI